MVWMSLSLLSLLFSCIPEMIGEEAQRLNLAEAASIEP